MKIAIVHYGEDSPSDADYRAGRYGALAQELHKRGHEVHRIIPSFSHRHRSQRSEIGSFHNEEGTSHVVHTSGYRSARGLRRLLFLRTFARAAAKAIERLTPLDAVVCGFPPPSAVRRVARAAHAGSDCNVIADVRDIWPDAQLATTQGVRSLLVHLAARMARRRARRAMDEVDCVVGISAAYLAWARAIGTSSAVANLALPIGCPPAAPNPPHERNLDVIFVGSLSEHFDFDSLLMGWRKLMAGTAASSGLSGARLVLVGDGPLMPVLRHRVESDSLTSVVLYGMLDPSECRRMMESSSVGVAPYSANATMSLPNKPFEYLAAGLPILASLNGELDDLIRSERIGFSNPSPTPEWWAEQLMLLLTDSRLREDIAGRALTLSSGPLSRESRASEFADLIERRCQ